MECWINGRMEELMNVATIFILAHLSVLHHSINNYNYAMFISH